MHLELQWAMFIPLTFWALHRAVDAPTYRRGALAGVCLALQLFACVYYGAFLSIALVVFVPLLIACSARGRVRGVIPIVATAAGVAVLLSIPFAVPYVLASRDLGGRAAEEVARYSATVPSYFATSSLNLLWGWTGDRWGSAELRLFPGVVALLLALVSLAWRPGRHVLLYAATAALAVELSFGLNGTLYRVLFSHVDALQGFRSVARFAIIASAALAVLAGFGSMRLFDALPTRRTRSLTLAVLLSLITVEGLNRPQPLTPAPPVEPPAAYQVIRSAAPGALLELPLPDLKRLPGNEPDYQLWSMWHWKPLVNGYSGYYPADYLMTVIRMSVFPGEGTLDRLRAHDVRYVIVHRAFYDREDYTRLMLRIASEPQLKPWGAYRDTVGTADIFELMPR
ncbi:MAG: hypothetical protein QM736_29015 [Vicinamibacterales bacterium]